MQLQAKAINLVKATDEVDSVTERLLADDQVAKFSEAFAAAVQMCGDDIHEPRVNKRQDQRNNVPADSPFGYYKRTIGYSLLDQTVIDLVRAFGPTRSDGAAYQGICW